jgi:hypothetical protein
VSPIGQPERATQNRVIALFRDEPHNRTLGNWIDRDGSKEAIFAAARHQPRTGMSNRDRSGIRRPASVSVPALTHGGAIH